MGVGLKRGSAGGLARRARRRITLARETPSAAQAATIEMPPAGAIAAAASVKARRRWASAGCSAGQQLS